ncbi:hypothetical protein BC832DRAFT_363776 [Gaertneriomyces semiglobifer]|nr:hypothetical protein BC832DRAFT_363776 [Gaertneriomyces semiglobifer]
MTNNNPSQLLQLPAELLERILIQACGGCPSDTVRLRATCTVFRDLIHRAIPLFKAISNIAMICTDALAVHQEGWWDWTKVEPMEFPWVRETMDEEELEAESVTNVTARIRTMMSFAAMCRILRVNLAWWMKKSEVLQDHSSSGTMNALLSRLRFTEYIIVNPKHRSTWYTYSPGYVETIYGITTGEISIPEYDGSIFFVLSYDQVAEAEVNHYDRCFKGNVYLSVDSPLLADALNLPEGKWLHFAESHDDGWDGTRNFYLLSLKFAICLTQVWSSVDLTCGEDKMSAMLQDLSTILGVKIYGELSYNNDTKIIEDSKDVKLFDLIENDGYSMGGAFDSNNFWTGLSVHTTSKLLYPRISVVHNQFNGLRISSSKTSTNRMRHLPIIISSLLTSILHNVSSKMTIRDARFPTSVQLEPNEEFGEDSDIDEYGHVVEHPCSDMEEDVYDEVEHQIDEEEVNWLVADNSTFVNPGSIDVEAFQKECYGGDAGAGAPQRVCGKHVDLVAGFVQTERMGWKYLGYGGCPPL